MKHLKITTTELAKICGVSQGTVDRALNNRFDIKAETKEKILNTAKLYGYRHHIGGNDEIAGQIGIIVFDLNNDYFSELITETENILNGLGFVTVIMMSHYDRSREIECIRNMYNMGVNGIILCSVNCGAEFEKYLKMLDIPIVAVGNNIGIIPYVGTDDFSAMYDMTKYVLSEKYTDLIYFSPALKYPNAFAQQFRYNGFKKAAENTKYTVITDIDEVQTSYDDKTAIICSTDYYAFGIRLKTKDVKVTGFDNLKAIKKYNLHIDSVGYSTADIAAAAVDVIISMKKDGVIIPHTIEKHPFVEAKG